MALNWNAFLTDEGLALPDDQWSDFPQTTSTDSLSAMPKPIPGRKPGSEVEDPTGYDPLFNGVNFDQTLFNPNDYFLSDLEILQPFGDTLAGGDTTSESSPEPTSGVSLKGPFSQTDISSSHTPASTSTRSDEASLVQNTQRPTGQRAQTFPNATYESMFPNNLDSGFVEDLTFPNGPSGTTDSSNCSVDNGKEPNEDTTTTKRNKNKPDSLSACWTSPLCPNHDGDGPPPNPSNCSGGCAPFLFASDAPSIMDDILRQPQELIAEEGVVEIQPRRKKRSESASSSEPAGRQFPNPNTTATPAEDRARMKSDTKEASSQQVQPPAEDEKPKSRRRLPHNQVERKYRESLNTQLESLRRVVPALQQNPQACDGVDMEDLPTPPSKPSKAVILASATAYIKQMEKEKKAAQEENQILRTRVKALQALVKCDDCSIMQYVMDLKISNGPKCPA
jgi:hypothetical protein